MYKIVIAGIIIIGASMTRVYADEGKISHVFEINYADPNEIREVLETVKNPGGSVTSLESTHQVVVYDTPQKISAMSAIVDKLDKRLDQVGVRVTSVEISANTLKSIGLGGVLSPDEFNEIKHLLVNEEKADLTADTFIRTESGQAAEIAITDNQAHGGTITRENGIMVITPPRDVSAGTSLKVLPRVMPDGKIRVIVRPTISEFIGSNAIHGRSLNTDVVVNRGDTIVLGGVVSDTQKQTAEAVPGVGLQISSELGNITHTVIFLTVEVLG